jgi:hypothetical protein
LFGCHQLLHGLGVARRVLGVVGRAQRCLVPEVGIQ